MVSFIKEQKGTVGIFTSFLIFLAYVPELEFQWSKLDFIEEKQIKFETVILLSCAVFIAIPYISQKSHSNLQFELKKSHLCHWSVAPHTTLNVFFQYCFSCKIHLNFLFLLVLGQFSLNFGICAKYKQHIFCNNRILKHSRVKKGKQKSQQTPQKPRSLDNLASLKFIFPFWYIIFLLVLKQYDVAIYFLFHLWISILRRNFIAAYGLIIM